MTIINSYKNGNCFVSIENDGTKIRQYEGVPRPEFPESIDLKITNYCDAACPFCHEQSTKFGIHALKKDIITSLDKLVPGVEIAIGGGNPLSHPELEEILDEIKIRGLIANITIHEGHVIQYLNQLINLQEKKLIYGIGISIVDCGSADLCSQCNLGNNIVYHIIVGITDPQSLIRYYKNMPKILILGYKKFGFGLKYYKKETEINLNRWKYWIGTIIKKISHVSFDNLAIEQLNIKDLITPKHWEQVYMGDDGEYTMYIDAVKNEYAISSTSQRYNLKGMNAKQAFQKLKCL